jgi:hypothetical protein
MQIKDLSRELSAEEQAAVAGGGNVGLINSPTAAVGGAGFAFASPTIAIGSTNVLTQLDNDVKVDIDTKTLTNTLVGSLANIGQAVA